MSKWEMVRLGDVCEIARGGSPRPIENFITEADGGVNWIKIGDTIEGEKYITGTKQKITQEGVKKSRSVHPGDFLLSNSMSFGKPYILAINGCIHDGWLVISDINNLFSKDFLYYLLGSPNMYTQFKSLAVGGVVNNLNSNIVRKVKIPLPPLDEQKRIAKNLDLASEIVKGYKEQLAELDKLIQSVFYEMFGDPVTNEKGWEMSELSNHLDVIGGYAFSSKGFAEEGIPVLKIGNINSGRFKSSNLVFWKSDNKLERYMVYPGDLLISLTGTVGKEDYGNICVIGDEYSCYYLNQRNAKLKLKGKLDTYYLSFLLKVPEVKGKLTDISRGVRQANISNSDILHLKVPVPPLAIQTRFASLVTEIEDQKVQVQQALSEAKNLFNSLMQEYFE